MVVTVIAALKEWDSGPFDLTQQMLRSLCSGTPALNDVVDNLDTAHDKGNKISEEFIGRLTNGSMSIHASIRKLKTKTFATKVVEAKNKSDVRVVTDKEAMKKER